VFTEIDKGIRGSDMGTNHDSIGIKVCHECQSQIKDDEPYVCFKIPAKTDWILFYNRRPGSDCWEIYLRKAADHQRDGNHGKRAQEPGRPLMAPTLGTAQVCDKSSPRTRRRTPPQASLDHRRPPRGAAFGGSPCC